jgi:mono/diheme cytochrome c family protein
LKLNPTRILLLCLGAAVPIPALAQGSGADTFKARCMVCHGTDGTANTPAGKFFKAASLKDPMVTTKSDDELETVVKNGKNKMPSFKDKLTTAQIDAVIGYIRHLPS